MTFRWKAWNKRLPCMLAPCLESPSYSEVRPTVSSGVPDQMVATSPMTSTNPVFISGVERLGYPMHMFHGNMHLLHDNMLHDNMHAHVPWQHALAPWQHVPWQHVSWQHACTCPMTTCTCSMTTFMHMFHDNMHLLHDNIHAHVPWQHAHVPWLMDTKAKHAMLMTIPDVMRQGHRLWMHGRLVFVWSILSTCKCLGWFNHQRQKERWLERLEFVSWAWTSIRATTRHCLTDVPAPWDVRQPSAGLLGKHNASQDEASEHQALQNAA